MPFFDRTLAAKFSLDEYLSSPRIQEYFMVKTNLTDEEKKLIIEALNNNIEPSAELMIKLFPGLFYL